MDFGYGDASKGGIDAVFTAVTLSNGSDAVAAYNYYYDAQGRRWMKLYPTLKADEFFYDSGHLLLEDRGNDALDSATPAYPIDEYVWLAGRPVAFLRSSFDAGWNRANDLQGSCRRNGEEAACGLYFLVTDHIGKPAVVLDSAHRIAGAAEGDPFGEANSRPLAGDTAHPSTGGGTGTLSWIDLGPGRGLARQVRVKFAMVDTAGPDEAVSFVDSSSAEISPQRIGGLRKGPVWSDWVDVPDGDGVVAAAFTAGDEGHEPVTGVSVELLEYRVRSAGAAHAWPRIRFPGHYADAETRLSENWHRYYNPSIGRYLQPEPLMQRPTDVAAQAAGGIRMIPYAYANDNPFHFVDASGLDTQVIIWTDSSFGTSVHAAVRIDRGPGGDPILFDPGGGYAVDGARGSGGWFSGDEADLSRYVASHDSEGNDVTVYNIATSAADERQIAANFQYPNAKDVPGGYCARVIARRIRGVGPFRKLGIPELWLPTSLASYVAPLSYRTDVYRGPDAVANAITNGARALAPFAVLP
jgi:RHS repeat-associated protein